MQVKLYGAELAQKIQSVLDQLYTDVLICDRSKFDSDHMRFLDLVVAAGVAETQFSQDNPQDSVIGTSHTGREYRTRLRADAWGAQYIYKNLAPKWPEPCHPQISTVPGPVELGTRPPPPPPPPLEPVVTMDGVEHRPTDFGLPPCMNKQDFERWSKLVMEANRLEERNEKIKKEIAEIETKIDADVTAIIHDEEINADSRNRVPGKDDNLVPNSDIVDKNREIRELKEKIKALNREAEINKMDLEAKDREIDELRKKAQAACPPPEHSMIVPPPSGTLYVGLNASGTLGRGALIEPDPSTNRFGMSGWLAGGTLGYEMPNTNWRYGIEADIAGGSTSGQTKACIPACRGSNTWLTTVRGRVGYDFDPVMVYGTGGLAVGDINLNVGGLPGNGTIHAGWAAGGGIRLPLSALSPLLRDDWTAKVEWLHVDLGSPAVCTPATCGSSANVSYNSDVFRLGIDIPLASLFGSGAKALAASLRP